MLDRIHLIDTHFQAVPEAIAVFCIPHDQGALLIETGPSTVTDTVTKRLDAMGLVPSDVTDVLVTHIHLDHAGAAGWWAEQGATVHVHEVGAPHLADPSKLMKSASRIYGDDMDRLWGEMRPVPTAQLNALADGDTVTVGDVTLEALDTPGHAYHHHAYLLDGIAFTGDVAGVRLPGSMHMSPPLAPPEIDLDAWRASIDRLRARELTHIAPTHFGLFTDAEDHLDRLADRLDAVEAFTKELMTSDPTDNEIETAVTDWLRSEAEADGVEGPLWTRYETANPSWMAAMGLKRFWQKHRADA
ncbi:MBL fold metallo-hydrolase [Longimonas halophila]|uniref:MBL fold metallo-hydrolase n=1 Tax=Longimonas halophila TaxID=1469170 RepID=A0A2H3P3C2_9BACT|nr:MBL fold metallo-hydrolase [Longimonas halophila]PEN05785.1 MBL fold metallo-hydrolase [Longimonas halophila]